MMPPVDHPVDAVSSKPFRLIRGLAGCVGATVVIALLTGLAETAKMSDSASLKTPSDPSAAFVPSASFVVRPAVPVLANGPRFRLDEVDPVNPARSEPPRLNPSTGEREDTLSQGDFRKIEGPYLRITITEGSESRPHPSLFVTLARRGANGLGLSILKTGERGRLESKFGSVDTLDAMLGGPITRTCTGFMTSGGARVRLDGWLCAPLGQLPEPRAVVCALERVVLNGLASSDLEALVQAAETQPDRGCASAAAARPGEAASQTGSIDKRRGRKNKAELRRSAQARP